MDVAWKSHHLDRYTSHDIPQMLCAAAGSATLLTSIRRPTQHAHFRLATIRQSGPALSLVVRSGSLERHESAIVGYHIDAEAERRVLAV